MKKIYWIFSLLLMVLGINTAYAGVKLGEEVKDPNTLKNGSKIIIRADAVANEANQTFKHFSALADSLVYAITTIDQVDPYVAYVLETADGKTVKGQQAYYLKNEFNGRYLTYVYEAGEDGSVSDSGDGSVVVEMRLTFTDDKAKATPVVITSQKTGAEWMGYKGKDPTTENCMMIIAEFPEHNNDLIAFNCVYEYPLIASYNDWAAWWHISIAEFEENYYNDLKALYQKVVDINYIAGTDPGCYSKELVDAFTAAKKEAENLLNSGQTPSKDDCKAAFEKLETAYLALLTNKAVPVTEGYYRLFNAASVFTGEKTGLAYADKADNRLKWEPLDSEDASQVWQMIDRHDGTWTLYNVGTGLYVTGTAEKHWSGSPLYAVGSDSTNVGILFSDLGQSQFNIYVKGKNSFHAASSGSTSESIVAYSGSVNSASAWYVKAVSEEEAKKFEEIGKQSMLNRTLEALYSEAHQKYNIGSSFNVDKKPESWLVTAADFKKDNKVIYSNQDQNTLGDQKDGDGYIGLVDNNEATWWHSFYGNGYLKSGGYLQFKLNKETDAFSIYLTKRANQPNQATGLDIYVSNTPDDENSWTKVNSVSGLPGSSTAEDLTYESPVLDLYGKYSNVRIYWKSNNGFTHFTGLVLQPATLTKTCQNATIGEVATNLKTVLVESAALIQVGKATQEAIDKLQKALDAYTAELADPTELKTKLDSITDIWATAATPTMKVVGSEDLVGFEAGQPGVYKDEDKAALKAEIDKVQNYINTNDAKGTYTKEDIKNNLNTLNTALATFRATAPAFNVANASTDGSWYYISYSEHYFKATGKTPDQTGEGDNLQIRKGKVYVNADANKDNLNNAELNVTGNKTLEELNINEDLAKWRFVNMGDTAYAIQNKATGLYIGEKTSGNAGLSMTPVAFKVSELGYATFLFGGYRYDGKTTNQLHVQTVGQKIVYWPNKDLGGGSCFDLEATKEPANNTAKTVNKLEEVIKGRLYIKCYPVGLEFVFDELNQYGGAYQIATIDMENKQLTLTALDGVDAGVPFFYIAGGKELGVSQEPTKADTISLGVDLELNKVIAAAPGTNNGLIGNYYGGNDGTKVEKGFGVVGEKEGVQSIASTTEGQQIGWNSGYIDAAQIKNADQAGEIVVPISGNLVTAIEDAIKDAQNGPVNVYSIDGILIKKNVKVSEATKGLSKGIYIVGNKKIAVQ